MHEFRAKFSGFQVAARVDEGTESLPGM